MSTQSGHEADQVASPSDVTPRRAHGAGGFGRVLLVIVSCLLVVAPTGVGVFAITRYDQAPGEAAQTESVSTFVSTRVEQLGARDALLTGTWTKGAVVYAPAWSGVVSGLPLRVGDVIHSYDTVVEVDGVARQGWRTDRPFYRSLASDDKGEDVKTLQKALSDLGFLRNRSTGVMDGATVSAVKAFSKKIGFATAQEVFDPGWVVFLPLDEVIVATIDLAVSATAPGAGETILAARDSLADAVVAPVDGDLPLPAEQWTMILDGQGFRYDDAGHVIAEDRSALEQSGAWSAKNGDEGGVRVTIQRLEPLTVLQVPVTAVGVGADGRHCVWTATEPSKDGAKFDYEAVVVELVPDRLQPGVAMVTGLSDGVTVVGNPRAALGLVSCP